MLFVNGDVFFLMTIFVVFHKIRTRQALIWLFPQNNRKRALFAFSPRPPVNISFQLPVPLIQKIHLPSLWCVAHLRLRYRRNLESSWNLLETSLWNLIPNRNTGFLFGIFGIRIPKGLLLLGQPGVKEKNIRFLPFLRS